MHRGGWRFYNLSREGRATCLTLLDEVEDGQDAGACCSWRVSNRGLLWRLIRKVRVIRTRCEASIGCIDGSSGLSLGDWKSPNTQPSRNPAG